jgi:hypothetical protein
LATLIRHGLLASYKDEFQHEIDLGRRFPWLKLPYLCIVWIQPVLPPAKEVDGIHWIPAIVDTGYSGSVAMRLEHFRDIGGARLLNDDQLNELGSHPKPSHRGVVSTVQLNVRMRANVTGQRMADPGGPTRVLTLSEGIELFLPADYGKIHEENDRVRIEGLPKYDLPDNYSQMLNENPRPDILKMWYPLGEDVHGNPIYNAPDRRCQVPLIGMQTLIGNGLSFLLNTTPKYRQPARPLENPPPADAGTFRIADRPWWPWL